MSTAVDTEQQPPAEQPEQAPEPSRWRTAFREFASGSVLSGILAVLLAVLVGSVLIIVTDEDVRAAAHYFFAEPSAFFNAAWDAVWGAYTALFRGAIYNTEADTFEQAIKPLTETLKFAGPLIAAGLGVGIAFRAGLFNIGGQGQMLLAGAAGGWVGYQFDLPAVIHLPFALITAMAAGALWAGIAGLLKARTGAHEVIVTIMLNHVAYYLVLFALSRQALLQAPGSFNPKSLPMKDSAHLPKLFGDTYNLHLGFVIALLAVVFAWWLLERSSLGFRIRAVGINPTAARASGINVGNTWIVVMLISGALIGIAGANQVLGTVSSGITVDLDAGIGFDAITVALLGRSRPIGVLFAGLLFGALKAGGFAMQASQGIPIDIVLVVQSLIVLFLAAPPLIKAIFRLPAKEAK